MTDNHIREVAVLVYNENKTPCELTDSYVAARFYPHLPPISEVAYPTDEKERQQIARREAKAAGKEIERKKRPKFVQDHTDDCGEDLSSLGVPSVEETEPETHNFSFVNYLANEDSSSDDDESSDITDNLEQFMLYGPCPELHCYMDSLQVFVASNMDELDYVANTKGNGIDIAEVCGGEGRSTQIGVRRHLTVGRNFDLVTQCDLSRPKDASEAFNYFEKNKVLVAVMAPCCDCFGPMSHLNWSLHYDTMLEKYKNGSAVARFCGRVAALQLSKGLDFLCEQPYPSDLFCEGEWPAVLKHPPVEQVVYHRCRCGLKVQQGQHKGLFIKKPSTMTVSCPELGDPFRNKQCLGNHEHLSGKGNPAPLSQAQVWTWKEAELVVEGCLSVRRRHARGGNRVRPISAFPAKHNPEQRPWIRPDGSIDRTKIAHAASGGAPTPGVRDPRAPPMATSPCLGCSSLRYRGDIDHNRKVGECSYPYDEPDIWACDACLLHRNRLHHTHTQKVGECKWPLVPLRAAHKRKGKHPRDPAQPASDDPTANAPGTSSAGELGADAEQAVSDAERAQMEDEALEQLERETGPQAASSSSGAPRAPRGPDTVQRTRKETARIDQSVGGGNTTDWTNYDVARSLKAIRLGTDAQQRLVLRKLHLRWWHASASAMHKLLERAGCPPGALDKIKTICDTCAACRTWARPQPESVASLEIADKFNQQVEYDLVFIYKFEIFHLVDRCTRWEMALLVDNKEEETLVDAIDAWVNHFGPMTQLIGDGESGIVRSHYARKYFERKGIQLIPRGKDQHARIAERRGALLRDQIHRMDAQLKADGILDIPFKHRLTEAVFAGNALLTVNNSTPYNAVYGRVPKILPDINCPDAEHEEDVPKPGLIRHVHRLREIAVQAMIDGTAKARLGRAMHTRTLPAGEREGFQVGEEVDTYRAPGKFGQKDISGWHGPATIVDLTRVPRGIIAVRSNNIVKDCRVGDVRRHLAFPCFLAGSYSSFTGAPGWSTCKQLVEDLSVGQMLNLGWVKSNGNWHLTKDTDKFNNLYNTLIAFGRNHLRLDNLWNITIGHGVGSTGKITGFAEATTLWWRPGNAEINEIEQTSDFPELDGAWISAILWQRNHPDHWRQIRFIRFAAGDQATMVNADLGSRSQPSTLPATSSPNSRLSTIPEENSEDLQDLFAIDPDIEGDEDFQDQLRTAACEASYWCNVEADLGDPDIQSRPISEVLTADLGNHIPYVPPNDSSPTITNYHTIAANVRSDLPADHRLDEEPEFVELAYDNHTWKFLPDVPRQPEQGEVVVVRFYHAKAGKPAKRIVNVERDDNLLTAEEVKKHAEEVKAAMLKELQTWASHTCFSRRSRHGARNIIDCKWVLKWKWDTDTVGADQSASGQAGASRRVIRARLTIRGFKDVDKGNVATYAGTSQRFSQRILVSEAVIHGWPIATSDISKAFLQGVTYEELAELTGEPVREVNFFLPAYNIPQLQSVPGFETFDPNAEVLHCDKPGTGSVDAPRCFSLKLTQATDKCGLVPSNVDPELCYLHETRNGKLVLVAVMTKHVDDLKICGEKDTIVRIMKAIEEVFGQMKITWNVFTNCGVRHIQDVNTMETTLDQTEYIAGIKTIPPESYRNLSSNAKCEPILHQQYQSLLGAVAFTGLSRLDVLVFIVALQRYSHAPQVIHVKRLNVLVRWMQANPKKLCYRRFKQSKQHLKIIADSSFKKEEEKGHSLRGLLIVRCDGDCFAEGGTVHVLDFATKALRFVTRSTFSAELMGACDSFDHGLLLLFILNELAVGVPSKTDARQMREYGGFAVPAILCVDALSVFAAVTAVNVKPPAEKGLLAHVQYLREVLDHLLLEALCWWDTRDMTADGMTKGAVEREALHLLMEGELQLKHTPKLWKPHRK